MGKSKTSVMAWPLFYAILCCCAGKFFWYVFFMFIILFFFTCYGMTVVAVVPNIQVIIITTPIITTALNSVITITSICVSVRSRVSCTYSSKHHIACFRI